MFITTGTKSTRIGMGETLCLHANIILYLFSIVAWAKCYTLMLNLALKFDYTSMIAILEAILAEI
jgi:hypothetical protein